MTANFETAVLGETRHRLHMETADDNRRAALSLARQTRRQLRIFTRDCDPRVFDTIEFVDAARRVAIASRFSFVHVLVLEPKAITQRGHRILELVHRLSSYVEIRVPHEDHRDRIDTFLLADDQGFLYRRQATTFEGNVNFHDPRRNRELMASFEEMWDVALPDPETRRLHL